MSTAADRLSTSVRSLDLPLRLARRLDRSIDHCLRSRAGGERRLRAAIAEASGVLSTLGGSLSEIRSRLCEAVTLHAEERGFRASSVLAVAPVHQLLAADVARWVDETLGGDAEGAGTPALRTARWQVTAERVRARSSAEA